MSGRLWVVALGVVMGVTGGVLAVRGQNEPPAEEQSLEPLAMRLRNFLQDVSVGQAEEAFDTLLAGGPLADQAEAVQTLVDKAGRLEEKYGNCRGFEQIKLRRLGTDVALFTYLYKCEQLPVAWQFTLYRTASRPGAASASDAWHVVAVRFDTALENLRL